VQYRDMTRVLRDVVVVGLQYTTVVFSCRG